MKRPKITDVKASKYVDYLEDKLKGFEIGSIEAESYLSLKNFISQGNALLAKIKFDGSELGDKDDKQIERGLKFADKMLDHNSALRDLFEKVGGEKIKELEGRTYEKKVASSYEAAMPERK
tara:strand:- start:5551 stop:5913 length:363 start_codon:yes stop_codon:yes gene_type:complete